MDPLNSHLARFLLEEITPVIMVLSTPLAEEACQKNGINFVEMLLPFSLFNKIDVPVRTANDQPYRLQMFRLRLVYASDVCQKNYEVAKEHLKHVVNNASQKIFPNLPSEPIEIETLLSKKESDLQPSWIPNFNKELIQSVSFSEHETFDHPVACLLVVSSKDERPINRFIDLFNTNQLPSLLNDGVMDPKILKHYLLLHDNQEGSTEKSTNILAEMRNTFGSNSCKLLCINSAEGASGDSKHIQWVPYRHHVAFGSDVAHFLSSEDLNAIKDFMQEVCCNHLIPYLEQKIRILNQQVSTTRKGLRNQIKNLWFRKAKEDVPETTHGPTYTFSSIESQMRVLGDYAFMLRDYELALSNYRLLSTDYRLDKAWKRYAGAQEMSALSYYMLDQSGKVSECMEDAFTCYLKIGSIGQRYATRCGLWWAEMLKARGQFRDAANIYFRISSEEPPLHAAVMLEQASYCYLLSRPPMFRKYGFHLVLAGNRYYISDERQHAIRVYRSAILVYKEKGWSFITDHVHFNVGRWYAFLGIFDVAIKHMLEVLACGHQSLATQKLFLSDFLHVVQSMGKKIEVHKLQLPVINMSTLKVIFEDNRTYASSSAASASESLWQSLEEELVPSVPTVRSNWLDAQPLSSSLKRYNSSCICVAGEAIKVELEFKNPLQVPLSVTGASLICELSARSEATNTDGTTSPSEIQDDTKLGEACTSREFYDDSSLFISRKLNFVLAGGETNKVQLLVVPKVEGVLTIVGVKWTLSDSVVGYQYFEFSDNKNKKGRRARNHLDQSMSFVVIKELPRLDGYIRNISEKLPFGDLRLLSLELQNKSPHHVKNIKMKISQPRFLIPGSGADMSIGFPKCLEKQISGSGLVLEETITSSKNLLFLFPKDTCIQGGTTFTWPLWFHAGYHGKTSLYISIYYEVDSSSDMTYRTLRMHYDLEVFPALDVSFQISPCPLTLQELLVRMDVVNRTRSDDFIPSQLSCAGDHWEISPLPTSLSICPIQILPAGQAVTCYFKLKDCGKTSSSDSKLTFHGSDLEMGSHESKEMLIDVSRSPWAAFHQYERYHQGKLGKGDSGIVDFILISKPPGSRLVDEPGAPPKLLCNYDCHCSITTKSPVSWLMDGPRIVRHDFSTPFCEACLQLTIHNCSNAVVTIRIVTHDDALERRQLNNVIQPYESSGNDGGWHDVSLVNDIKTLSNIIGDQTKELASEATSPYIWSGLSSTKLNLDPATTAEIPLKACIFAPGTYDMSNYELHWSLNSQEGNLEKDVRKWSPGSAQGHPFYLTVLQIPD